MRIFVRWLHLIIVLTFSVSLLGLPQPASAAAITSVNFRWDGAFSGGSIIADRCIAANYHWLTSEELTPNPRQLGSWRYGAINGCVGHYPAIGVQVGDVIRIGIGASDSPPPSDLFRAVETRRFDVTRVDCCNLRWNEVPNIAPNRPQPTSPASGTISASPNVTLSWQDMGDPDNWPRTSRDYYAEIWKTDNSWRTTLNWQFAPNWSLTVPGDGTYAWHVQSGDGLVASGWSAEQTFTISTNQPPRVPQPLNPSNGATLRTQAVTLQWQDAGDPDNGPRNYRDYDAELWKSDNSWRVTLPWQTTPSWSISVPRDGTYVWRVRAGDGVAASAWTNDQTFTVVTGNQAPNLPTLIAPAHQSSTTSRALTLRWEDGGDPDNAPRTWRDYDAEIWKADNSWRATLSWQGNTNWAVTVPSDGTYFWRVRAGDGAAASPWATPWSVNVQASNQAQHTETRLRGANEGGTTTIFLKICGQGANYRFRSEAIGGSVLFDRTYGSLNGCTNEYRAVIQAGVGERLRFLSTVMNGPLSDADFVQRSRHDSCLVVAVGVIACQAGDIPPTPPPPPTNDGVLNVRYVDQVYVQRYPDNGWWNHCGPSSVAMLLHYTGKETRDVFTDRQATLDLVRQVKPPGWGAASWAMIQTTLRNKGLQISATSTLTAQEIANSLANNRPVLLGMTNPGHIVLIVGRKANGNFVIHDPMGGKNWWTTYSVRNDSPWVNGFPSPRTKGQWAEYSYQELAARGFTQLIRVTGGASLAQAVAQLQTTATTLTGQGIEAVFPGSAALARSVPISVTHTPLLSPTHALGTNQNPLVAFTLAAQTSAGSLDQLDQPYNLTVQLDPDLVDALELPTGSTTSDQPGTDLVAENETLGPAKLRLMAWDRDQQRWNPVAATVDRTNYRITTTPTALTEFAVVVEYQHAVRLPLVRR